jgi:hypothetical protein
MGGPFEGVVTGADLHHHIDTRDDLIRPPNSGLLAAAIGPAPQPDPDPTKTN